MKKFIFILIGLAVILVVLGAGLQWFLTRGLTDALNNRILPVVQARTGLDIGVTNAVIRLRDGSAVIEGLAVRNLPDYKEPHLLTADRATVRVNLFSLLLRNPIVVSRVHVEGVELTIEKNRQRHINLRELSERLQPDPETDSEPVADLPEPIPVPDPSAEPAAPQPEPTNRPATDPADEPTPASRPLPVQIRHLELDGVVRYIDSHQGRSYTMELQSRGENLFSVPAAGQPDTLLTLTGSMKKNKNTFRTDLSLILEPPVDPESLDFTATGHILDMDIELIEKLLEKNNMAGSSFSVKPSIRCTGGRLDGSNLDLILNDLVMYRRDIGDTALRMPLRGTLQHPSLDLTGAFQSLFSRQALNIGRAIAAKELGSELGTNAPSGSDLAGALTNRVKEVADTPALRELLDRAAGNSTPTSRPAREAAGDALFEQLEKNVKEIEGNEAVRETLKGLFGN